jgi:hypothetical protein
MTEYYTTRSLSTAAAAIEQGFEGCESYACRWWYDGLHQMIMTDNIVKEWRFPKTPHNVALMYPVTGDIIKTQDPNDKHRYQLGYWEHVSCYSLLSAPTIITRTINSKPVPMPVWDKEEV